MSKIIHLEDSEDFRNKVKNSLISIPGLSVKQYNDFGSFVNSNYPDYEADLFILDRHFPDSSGELGDNLWKAAKHISFLNQNNQIIVLTHSPPSESDWRKFPCIREVFNKYDFNPEMFKERVSEYLEMGGRK